MSDSFADLWASTTPSKPPTLASTSRLNPNIASTSTSTSTSTPPPPKQNPAYGKPDLFALLSSSSSSGGSSTPRHGAGSSSGRSTPSMLGVQRTGSAASNRGGGGGGGADAFSDLFAGSTTASASANGGKNMTLAARLALEKQQQQKQQHQSNGGVPNAAGGGNANSGVWVGLDSLGSGLGGRNPSHHKPVQDEEDNDWGLGDFGGAASKSSASTKTAGVVQATKKTTEALWDLDEFSSSTATAPSARTNQPTTKPTNTDTLWNLDDLASTTTSSIPKATPNTTASQQTSKSKTLWDLDGFASSSPSHTPPPLSHSLHPVAPQSSRSSSSSNSRNQASGSSYKANDSLSAGSTNKAPNGKNKSSNGFDNPDEAFDFGTREDRGLLDLDDDDNDMSYRGQRNGKGNGVTSNQHQGVDEDDDILGMLSKPVDVVRASIRKKTPPPTASNVSTTSQRPPSPPPHILGQIVEMGFSVSQARKALSMTKDGMDVQAALETLLNGGGGGDEEREQQSHHPPQPPPPPQRRVPPPTREEAAPRRAAPKGYKERERERMRAQRGETTTAAAATADSISVSEIQLHADKLVSQASEIGLSVFSKASAFWKEGKGKVVRAYEERVVGAGENESESRGGTGRVVDGSGRGKDGRPKWMTHEVNMDDEDEVEGPFVDRVGGDAKEAPVRAPPPPSSSSTAVVDEPVDLFSSNPKPTSTPQPPPRTRTLPPTTQTRSTLNLPTASPTTLSTAHTHKTNGTQAFKLGQYASACDAYSLAISLLPPQHLLLLPLYTNRALARLKTGEYAGAVEDCSLALGIIGSGDSAALLLEEERGKKDAGRNEGGWTDPQGLGVDLSDQHVKALKRRALALEGREKWEEAGRDWEVVAGMRVEEKTRGEAVLGAGRCRKMCAGGGGTATTAAAVGGAKLRPRPKPTPSTSSSSSSTQTPSAALTALQTQNAQAEADLTLQHTLKDTVDARLNAWRKGKESNIRALLASLDLVLWEDLLRGSVGGIGMAELVSPVQVKKAYVRAIGRVHPDKLNASNSTVEQRMLANGVFGTLNEAWIAFQAGQK